MRLIPVLLTRQLGIGLDDMFQYDMLARSLASGNGFRWYAPADLTRIAPYLQLDPAAIHFDPRGFVSTFRAPLYPGFLSLVYLLNGINDGRFFAARLAQTIPGALLAPLTYHASLNLIFQNHESESGEKTINISKARQISRLAAWVVAIYPTLLIYPLALATENIFFLLVLACMLALLKLAKACKETHSGRSVIYALLSGVLLGLAALTRSIIVPFGLLSIGWIWLSLKQPGRAILTALALFITIAPWIIRNSLVSHRLTGIETSMGYNLYIGYYPQSTGTFMFGPSLDLLSILDDRTRDEVGTQKALEFIRQDPARVPYLILRRTGYFFNMELRAFTYFYVNDYFGPISAPWLFCILLVLGLPFVILSLSTAFGAVLLPASPQTLLLAFLLIGYLLPNILILSEERFHLTLIPFLAICAANLWANSGFNALKTRGAIIILIAGIAAILLLVNWGFELYRDGPVLVQMFGPNGHQLYLPY